MKRIFATLTWAALLAVLAAGLASGQREPTVRQAGGRTFLDSQITLGAAYPPITNTAFVSMPVMQLKAGEVLPSRGVMGRLGMDRMLSLRQFDFATGARSMPYPVVGLMRCSNFSATGSFVKVIASKTALRAGVKAGEPLRSGGFLIEARRAIPARETIPSVRIVFGEKYFIFSIEEAPGRGKQVDQPQPALTIAGEHAEAGDREIALEAWRLSNASVREGILKPAQ